MADITERRRLNRRIRVAQALMLWGWLGLLIPLVGVILGIMAIARVRTIEEDYKVDDRQAYKLGTIRGFAVFVIIFSIMSAVFWTILLVSHS